MDKMWTYLNLMIETALKRVVILLAVIPLATLPVIERAEASRLEDCSMLEGDPRLVQEYRACLRMQISGMGGGDCIDCLHFEEPEQRNPWVDAIGHLAAPLAFFGSAWVTSSNQRRAQEAWSGAMGQSNEAWARAYASGHRQCTNRFNSFLNSRVEAGARPLMPDEAAVFAETCNNMGMGGYAGYGGLMGNGFGGVGNPWMGAGFSPGFMSGMIGPHFGYPGMMGGGMGYPGGMGFHGPGMGAGAGLGLYLGLGAGLGGGGMWPGALAYPGGMGMGHPGIGGGFYAGMGGPGMGMGMGFPGMGMGGMGMGMGFPGMGMGGMGMGIPGMGMGGMGMGMGIPGMGMGGMGFPGMGGGIYLGGGLGGGMGGFPGMGGGFGGGMGGYPGMGGGFGGGMGGFPGMGGGFGGGMGGFPGMGGGFGGGMGGFGGMGMGPGGMGMGGGGFGNFPGGSYWNNTGGWGAGGGQHQWWQQQMEMQRRMAGMQQYQAEMNQANQMTRQGQNQALWENYMAAGQDLHRQGHGYGGMGGMFGAAPYAAGNLGFHFSAGMGGGGGWF